MRRDAEDVFQIALTPRDTINAYLVCDIVIDAGPPLRHAAAPKTFADGLR